MPVDRTPQVSLVSLHKPQVSLLESITGTLTSKAGTPAENAVASQSCECEATVDVANQVSLVSLLFTTTQVMAYAGVSKSAIYKAINEGRLEKQSVVADKGNRKNKDNLHYSAKSVFALWPHAKTAWEAHNLQIIHKKEEENAALEAHKNDLVAIAKMPEWRRRVSDARQGILVYIQQEAERLEEQAQTQGDHSSQQEKAITLFIADALRKTLPPEIQTLLPIANARYREGGGICRRTIFGWKTEAEVNGGAGLAPKDVEFKEPDFAQHLLKAYRKPSKPSLRYVVMYDLWSVFLLHKSSGLNTPPHSNTQRPCPPVLSPDIPTLTLGLQKIIYKYIVIMYLR
jgi:hypothetical protein